MSNLLSKLRPASSNADGNALAVARGDLSLSEYIALVGGGGGWTGGPATTWQGGTPIEETDARFRSLVGVAHHSHGIVGALVVARSLILSQASPLWRNRITKQTFTNRALEPLQRPGFYDLPHLLKLAEGHASYAGTAFFCRIGNGITLLPPDRTRFVVGTNTPLPDGATEADVSNMADAQTVGYAYRWGKTWDDVTFYDAGEVAAWIPEPDPASRFRGQSWVAAVLAEILQDRQVGAHIRMFFEKAATPNMVVTHDGNLSPEEFEIAENRLQQHYGGTSNAYRTMLLAGGAKAEVVGSTLAALSLKEVTSGFESRIAARSRVPANIAGLRSGLEGSSLNAGNYDATRRMWGDGWVSPTMAGLMTTLQPLLESPGPEAELTFDRDAVMFLQEDSKDAAEISKEQAVAVNQLIAAGFDPDATVSAIKAGNLALLVGNHIGSPANGTPTTQTPPGD